MKLTEYRLEPRGYIALGIGPSPATQRDADEYDTPPSGYVDEAAQALDIKTRTGRWTFSSRGDAERIAEWIMSAEGADCYGVAVRTAEVVEVVEGE